MRSGGARDVSRKGKKEETTMGCVKDPTPTTTFTWRAFPSRFYALSLDCVCYLLSLLSAGLTLEDARWMVYRGALRLTQLVQLFWSFGSIW